MTYRLSSPFDAIGEIARVFFEQEYALIEVQEDKCFGSERYWELGQVTLDADPNDSDAIIRCVRRGAYEWRTTSLEEAHKALVGLLSIEEAVGAKGKDQHDRAIARVDRIMDATAAVAVRSGLVHPTFDAHSVENMPFRQGTTVIADTSGVLQGGLDFVSTFLHPAARIKIPAVVHMEVVNQADGFLKRRRASKVNTSALLLDHIVSQAGQRALLRLELRADTEVERSLLVGDPLRNAFQRDTDSEWQDLQLSVPLRSYCDRLILEAARQHQSQSNPGHRLQLLTSDQGFARMALAEGIAPLYFRSVGAQMFFGRTLTGTQFHPFRQSLHQVSLESVLWELATAFGAVRLATHDRSRFVEIAAFGEELTWSPVHSHNDLLWIRNNGLPPVRDEARPARDDVKSAEAAAPQLARPLRAPPQPRTKVAKKVSGATKQTQPAYYRFNLERMFNLIIRLADDGQLTEAQCIAVTEAKDDRGFSEFRRFLQSGDLAICVDGVWRLTDAGVALATALRDTDPEGIVAGLSRVPSVSLFFNSLGQAEVSKPAEVELPDRAETTYKALAEICLLAAPIPGEGHYPTPVKPTIREFATIALERFGELEAGDGLVSVGAWLEALVKRDGIHPERARRYLDEAQASALINRSTEGSTTDTRHDQHAIRVLRRAGSGVRVEVVHLYRGDFLIPNKSSSSLRLGAVQ